MREGDDAVRAYVEFFAATIRNPRTRDAYHRACRRFLAWCDARGVGLRDLQPTHVAAYIEAHPGSPPTVKQHLAALRSLGDYLVLSHILVANPAAVVRGPALVTSRGKAPVLTGAEVRLLLDTVPTATVVGLRDRALISVMLFAFSRVSAAVDLDVGDYFPQGKRWWLRLREKRGRVHEIPVHHLAEEALDAYLDAAARSKPPSSSQGTPASRPPGSPTRCGGAAGPWAG